LADLPVTTLIILDNLGWYCGVANVFIRQRQIQIVSYNNRNKTEDSIQFVVRIQL